MKINDEIILLIQYDKDMQKAIAMDSNIRKGDHILYLEMIGINKGKRERIRYKSLIDTLSKTRITLLNK